MRQNDTLQCANMVEPKKDMDNWRPEQVAFYSSVAWKNLRDYVKRRSGGLCEMCLKSGVIRPATVAHHIIHVTAKNVNDPQITLNPDNLMALCDDCHALVHSKKHYRITDDGRVVFL